MQSYSNNKMQALHNSMRTLLQLLTLLLPTPTLSSNINTHTHTHTHTLPWLKYCLWICICPSIWFLTASLGGRPDSPAHCHWCFSVNSLWPWPWRLLWSEGRKMMVWEKGRKGDSLEGNIVFVGERGWLQQNGQKRQQEWPALLPQFRLLFFLLFCGEPAEELMLLNCGAEEDSWQSLGQQGDPT